MVRERFRDDAFDAPDWWLDLARKVVGETKGQEKLIDQLGALVGQQWDRSKISNFVRGITKPTQAFAEALCRHFPDLPRPFFVPRNEIEARTLQAVADLASVAIAAGYKGSPTPVIRSGAKAQQLADLDQDRDQIEHELSHTDGITSVNEAGAKSRKRPRRVP